MKKLLLYAMTVGWVMVATAQKTFPVNGVSDVRPSTYALTNAVIHTDYQTKIENATLLISDGKVLAVGTNVSIPKYAQVIDLKGKYIYPAFIDPYTSYGLPKPERGRRSSGPQYETNNEGAFGWNEAFKAEYRAVDEFTVAEKDAAKWRKAGFGAVLTHKADGIHRGSSVFADLGDGAAQDVVINPSATAHFSFNKGTSSQLYPTSIMGMVALVRQAYYDADWYRKGGVRDQTNETLAAFNQLRSLPQVFEATGGKLRVLLADKIGDEFGVQYIIKGNGDEYQRLKEIKATNASLIIPVNFPEAYDVADPLEALEISYDDLKHWEIAPANPKLLNEAGVEFSFTSDGLKNPDDYLSGVRKAVKYGLSSIAALQSMTYTPAKQAGMLTEVGTLNKGKRANFIVSSDELFGEKDPVIHQTWIDGQNYENVPLEVEDLSGSYILALSDTTYSFKIEGEPGKQSAKIMMTDTTSTKATLKMDGKSILISFIPNGSKSEYRLSGWKTEKGMAGTGLDPASNWVSWTAERESGTDEEKKEDNKSKKEEDYTIGEIVYPFVAYGWKEAPKQEDILFKNATVWTMENEGVLESADVLVSGGKIKQIGKGLSTTGKTVDATGLHLTPGIIDEHSHIALSGVNESSHAVTSEVRMYDAVDSEDIDIYRQLAGGVVASQLLHGSANPVGGQSALIKLRWGMAPEDMRIKGADEYIKFALGENVKQSNRSNDFSSRFPQTRMGVEQVYVDAFTRAKAYDAEWKAYNNLSSKQKATAVAPRRDLQLEALAEIVNKERFITCHSYVQSEINMMMKVAEQFGFNVNTFTHILEGYKVADIMAEHGVGGGTFSDWWAYKVEVKDAIPYNAVLMRQAGVTVAINSDDAEMARRLNQEAAKTIKYGGLDEIEAMKMVTINPAKLLHLDDRMGSIKVGKDADLVLWTEHPLSVYAKAKMTLVDGRTYYDAEEDARRQEEIRMERARIIEKMKGVKESGGKTKKYTPKERHVWDCEEFVDDLND